MRRAFVDTSFFYAQAFTGDPHHQAAVEFIQRPTYPLVTTNFIFDELVTILCYDFGHEVASRYGQHLRESRLCPVVRLEEEDEELAWALFVKYADQKFSFTDCTSFAFMRRRRIREAAAFDAHFEAAGFIRVPAGPLDKAGLRR